MNVPEKVNRTRLLDRAFAADELSYLRLQPRFAEAVERLSTLDDFERACDLGQRLLDIRDQIQTTSAPKIRIRIRPIAS